VRGTARWRARRRLGGGSTVARCCRRSRGRHGEGAGQGEGGRGAPERRVDGESVQTASGGGVRRWRGCSGGHRHARRGPAAPVREGEAEVSPNSGNGEAWRALTGEGRTAATLGRSPAWRRGSGCGKPARRMPRLWERRRGGGPGGWTPRGGRAEEREGERGGPGCGVEQCGGVSSARHARAARCRTTVEDDGVGVTRSTRLTGGPGRDGGPIISGWVWCGEAVDTALTSGVSSTVHPIRFSNRIKQNQIDFKRIQICPKL
jgi:hypothetical protein